MSQAYLPATYTNYLDRMLARGAQPGQGGHLEASSVDVARALARVDSYPFIATAIVGALGMDAAEPLLRRAVRRQGRHRGNDVRREVERRGLPLDALHLTNYWDTPRKYSDDVEPPREAGARDAHYVANDIHGCGFHDQMRRLCPQKLAVLMCEEDHIAIAKEFNPAIEVWYPALLTRGEAKCVFRFSMPREAAERAAREADRASQAAREAGDRLTGERPLVATPAPEAYRQLVRVIVIFYHYLVDELLRSLGEADTERIVRQAMREMGTWRGKMMREDHQQRGWPLDVRNLITFSDDPSAGNAWVAENVILTETEHTKDIVSSAYSAMFEEMGTGRFAAPLFEDMLPAQATAYNPAISVAIPELMERGDPISKFHYRMT